MPNTSANSISPAQKIAFDEQLAALRAQFGPTKHLLSVKELGIVFEGSEDAMRSRKSRKSFYVKGIPEVSGLTVGFSIIHVAMFLVGVKIPNSMHGSDALFSDVSSNFSKSNKSKQDDELITLKTEQKVPGRVQPSKNMNAAKLELSNMARQAVLDVMSRKKG